MFSGCVVKSSKFALWKTSSWKLVEQAKGAGDALDSPLGPDENRWERRDYTYTAQIRLRIAGECSLIQSQKQGD